MPLNQKIHEWQQRIEHLCALIVKRPELTWLWEIRIKILMYLIHRYGESADLQADVNQPAHLGPRTIIESQPGKRQEACTSMRRSHIRILLESIHRVNCESKAAKAAR